MHSCRALSAGPQPPFVPQLGGRPAQAAHVCSNVYFRQATPIPGHEWGPTGYARHDPLEMEITTTGSGLTTFRPAAAGAVRLATGCLEAAKPHSRSVEIRCKWHARMRGLGVAVQCTGTLRVLHSTQPGSGSVAPLLTSSTLAVATRRQRKVCHAGTASARVARVRARGEVRTCAVEAGRILLAGGGRRGSP